MRPKRFPLFLAANEADTQAVAANAAGGGAVFEIVQQDSMLIPYGRWPHKVGLQVFDRAAAEAMVSGNAGVLAKVAGIFGARREFPIYVGHPDIPGAKDSDKKAYGWGDAAGMTAENDGLRIPVRYTDEGRALVEGGAFRFYSPTWYLRKAKAGMIPVALKSVGLTNDPNIPVPALSNESDESDESDKSDKSDPSDDDDTTTTPTPTMQSKLLTLLKLPPDTPEDDILAAVTALRDSAAANEAATATAEERASAAEATATAAEERATAAETTAANELAAARAALETAVAHAVNQAAHAGRLTPAEVPEKTAEILAGNDLAAGLQALGTLPAKMKTASATGDLGTARAALTIAANDPQAAARARRAQLVANEYDGIPAHLSKGERTRIAWRRASARHPELFRNHSTDAPA